MRPFLCGILVAVTVPCTLTAQSQTAPLSQPAKTPTYDAVVQGMSCKQQQSGQMDCEYNVGTSLRFVIAGVGQQDVAVAFFKVVDDGDYFASVVPLHGCVVVKPSQARSDSTTNLAFVSPQDGKVHRTWNACLNKPPTKK